MASDLTLKMNLIKEAAPFANLSADRLAWLADQVTELSLNAGDILFSQGSEGKECYLISAGQIEILLQEKEGSFYLLATLKAGAIFGETALLMEAPRNATARAKEPTQLLVLRREALLAVTESEARAHESLLDIMAVRSRPLREEGIESFSMKQPDGEEIFTLKNPQRLNYFRLSQEGWFIWQQLDGRKTVRELTMALYTQFQILNPSLVSHLISQLEQAGFIVLHQGANKQRKTKLPLGIRILLLIRAVMEAKWSFANVDRWISASYQRGIKLFFTPSANLLFALISLSGFFIFILHFPHSIELMKATNGAGWLLLATIPIVMFTLVLHELAHAYTTKFFGRAVHGFGLGWLWLGPIAFCDTSDMWLCPPRQRIWVDLAGVYLQFILAGLASLLSFCFSASPILLLLWYFSLLNYLVIFQNMAPTLQSDGYYTLMDISNTANLRMQALDWLISDFPKCLKQPKLLLQHKPEFFYWLSILVFLVLDFLVNYIVLNHLLAGLLGMTNPLYSLAISLVVVFISGLTLWGDIKSKRLKTRL